MGSHRVYKLLLAISFFGLSIMALSAVLSQTNGYELSIYHSTPEIFWVGMVLAIASGITTVVWGAGSIRIISSLVVASAVVIFSALPFFRGYHYMGHQDSLQHLGLARDLYNTGAVELFANPYPGMHTYAASLAKVTGLEITASLLLIPPIFLIIFIMSSQLLTRFFGGYDASIPIVLASTIPMIIAVVIPRLQPIATVSAMHFAPFVIWAGISLSASTKQRYRWVVCLSVLLQVSLLLYHPQFLLIAAALLTTYAILQIGYRKRSREGQWKTLTPIALICGLLILYRLPFGNLFKGAFLSFVGLFQSGSGPVTASGTGISDIGGSALVLYLRALSLQVTIGLLAFLSSVVSLYILIRGNQGDSTRSTIIERRQLFFLLGLTPVIGLGLLYTFTGGISQGTRYLSFTSGLGTVILAARLIEIRSLIPSRYYKISVSLVLILLIAISIPAAFASPYLFSPSNQVTESEMAGYGWTFNQEPENPIASVDTDVGRYLWALEGRQSYLEYLGSERDIDGSHRGDALVPSHFNNRDLSSWNKGSAWYLVITAYSKEQQTDLYNGIQFSEGDFSYLSHSESISRIYDNGGTQIRLVNSSG